MEKIDDIIKRADTKAKKIEREVAKLVKVADTLGKYPDEKCEFAFECEWEDILLDLDKKVCEFCKKYEIKLPY